MSRELLRAEAPFPIWEKPTAERQDQICQLDSEHGLSMQGVGMGGGRALSKTLPAPRESPGLWHTSRVQCGNRAEWGTGVGNCGLEEQRWRDQASSRKEGARQAELHSAAPVP